MGWTGNKFVRDNGVFTGPLVWTDDRDAGTKITAAHHDTHDQDIADGISQTLNLAGLNSPSADINWGGFAIANLAAGSSPSGAATFGQTVTAAALNSTTNLLTLTRSAGNITVDLTPLVIGGSTADFAKLSASDNVFQGQAEFAGPLSCLGTFSMIDATTLGTSPTWNLVASTNRLVSLINTSGASFQFSGTSGSSAISVNGATVWTSASLPASTFAGVLKSGDNATITGVWSFVGAGSMLLPSVNVVGGGNNSWTMTAPTGASVKQIQFFSNFSSGLVKFDYDATEGTRIYAGAARVWTNNNFRVIATAAPTGGVANDLAVVLSGANQGLWVNVAGTWTKTIAGP